MSGHVQIVAIRSASHLHGYMQAGDIETMEAQLDQANLGATASPAIANPSPAAAGTSLDLLPSMLQSCGGCCKGRPLDRVSAVGRLPWLCLLVALHRQHCQ